MSTSGWSIIHAFTCSQTSGTAVSSYTTDLLAAKSDVTPEEENAIKWSAASLYGGGADTVGYHCGSLFCSSADLITF